MTYDDDDVILLEPLVEVIIEMVWKKPITLNKKSFKKYTMRKINLRPKYNEGEYVDLLFPYKGEEGARITIYDYVGSQKDYKRYVARYFLDASWNNLIVPSSCKFAFDDDRLAADNEANDIFSDVRNFEDDRVFRVHKKYFDIFIVAKVMK